jgi:LemA protein
LEFAVSGTNQVRRLSGALAALIGLTLAGCGYNTLQSNDEQIKSSWSEVVNQYQRRADLIPNLVNTVKGFAAQEKEVLLGVTNARARVGSIQATPELLDSPEAFARFQAAQGEMSGALSRLLVVVENYPQLKSDANFRDLHPHAKPEVRLRTDRNLAAKENQASNGQLFTGVRDGEMRRVRQRLRQILPGVGPGQDPYVRQLRVRDPCTRAHLRELQRAHRRPRPGEERPHVLLRSLRGDGGRDGTARSRLRRPDMQLIKDLMSRDVKMVSPDMTIAEAAKKMRDGDFGMLPVGAGDILIGTISDRDIAIRAVAEDKGVATQVRDVMSEGVASAYEDESVEQAAMIMSEHQVRRLPVINREKRLVGIIALGDLAVQSSEARPTALALSEISRPS